VSITAKGDVKSVVMGPDEVERENRTFKFLGRLFELDSQ